MEKILKNKKILAGVVALVVIIGGAIIGFNTGKDSVEINKEKIEALIEADYEVEILEEKEDVVDFSIVGDLDEAKVDELSKELAKMGKGYGKKKMNVSVFKNAESKKDYSFHTEGLLSEIKIDYEVGKGYIGKYTEVPAVEKAKKIVNFNEGKISSAKDGLVTINMNMDFATVKSTPDKVAQMKAFVEMFKSINKDKKISNVIINVNESTEGIALSTENEKIIKETTSFVI